MAKGQRQAIVIVAVVHAAVSGEQFVYTRHRSRRVSERISEQAMREVLAVGEDPGSFDRAGERRTQGDHPSHVVATLVTHDRGKPTRDESAHRMPDQSQLGLGSSPALVERK
jgi:hypothetical protein